MKAIFLLALIAIAFAATSDEATLQRLEKSKFGSEVLDTIQLQLTAGDPADDLIRMLQGEEDRLDDEQDADDEFIMALQNQCVEDLARLVDEIAATRKRIQELEDLLTALIPIRQAKEDERANLEDYKALLIQKLTEIAAAKEEKDAEWVEEREAHDSQIAIIQKVKDIIVGGLQTSFLQTKAQVVPVVLSQVSKYLNSVKHTHYKSKGMTGIFRVLAQVAASQDIQANEGAIDRIVGLCNSLIDKLAESRQIEEDDYNHWIDEYTATTDALNASLQTTIDRINQLTVEINVLTKRINLATQELSEQEDRLQLKISQHDEREDFCDSAANRYAQDREARSDQREIVSDAIGLLTSKIRLLKSYVADRVVSLDRPIF